MTISRMFAAVRAQISSKTRDLSSELEDIVGKHPLKSFALLLEDEQCSYRVEDSHLLTSTCLHLFSPRLRELASVAHSFSRILLRLRQRWQIQSFHPPSVLPVMQTFCAVCRSLLTS